MAPLAVVFVAALAALGSSAFAAQAPVALGTAEGFAVLAGSTVTNAGFSTLNGDLGVSPGSAWTGFPPGTVNGTIHSADPVAATAQADLIAAYNDAAGRTPPQLLPTDVGGRTLTPAVYKADPALGLTGTLTLDGQGDPNAVFIFQIGSALTTAVSSQVNLVNGAQASNVFWQIGSSATLGTSSSFSGTIMALSSISMNDGVTLNGRALARNGAVTLINDTISPQSPVVVDDRTEPEIAVDGSLNDATLDEEYLDYNASYGLTVDAADFDDEFSQLPTSGVERVELLVDGVSQQARTQDCLGGGCSLQTAWTLNTGDFQRGDHVLDIVATDGAGNEATMRIDWQTYAYPDPLPPASRDIAGSTRIDGAAAGDGAGTATAPAGDVDYDGYDDLLVAAPRADPGGRADAGSVYLVRGVEAGASIDLASRRAVLLRIDGARPGELAGSSLANVGDVNGDLIEDWAIGAPATTEVNAVGTRGTIYVVFGRETGGNIDLAKLGRDGYRILGPTPSGATLRPLTGPAPTPFGMVLGRSSGWYDRTGGDVNGDDIPDLVVGAPAESSGATLAAGKAYVVFGKASSGDVDVTRLAAKGFTISGGGRGFRAGYSVAITGDLNGDDLADVAVSQPGGGPAALTAPTRAGSVAVVYGSRTPRGVTLADTMPAASGYVLNGTAGNPATGTTGDRLTAVGALGDVNGDERPDLGYAGALSGATTRAPAPAHRPCAPPRTGSGPPRMPPRRPSTGSATSTTTCSPTSRSGLPTAPPLAPRASSTAALRRPTSGRSTRSAPTKASASGHRLARQASQARSAALRTSTATSSTTSSSAPQTRPPTAAGRPARLGSYPAHHSQTTTTRPKPTADASLPAPSAQPRAARSAASRLRWERRSTTTASARQTTACRSSTRRRCPTTPPENPPRRASTRCTTASIAGER